MKYTKEKLEPIVSKCYSYNELLRTLELSLTGGNQSHIRKVIKREGLDTSHFKGQGWSKGKTFPKKYPIEDYLTNKRYINSDSLRKRLLKEGYFEYKCQRCLQDTHQGYEISLELHHINSKHNDNSLENLRILCPNCHSLEHRLARNCHKVSKKTTRKYSPRPNQRKVPNRPTLDTLLKEVKELGYCGTGRKYGVSDNAIRKWIKTYQTS